MVSKTVLACLAVLATISMANGSAGAGVNFGYCVTGVDYINKKFSLGFAIDKILGGVLNLVGNILSGVENIVSNLLGGFRFGSKPKSSVPFVAAPDNIQNFAGIHIGVGPIFGKLLAPSFGAGFDVNIFSDVHGALSLNLLNILQIDIGRAPPSVRNAISLELAAKKAAKISALLNKSNFKSGQWATISALILDYLHFADQKEVTVDLYGQATIKYIKIQVAILKMSGYPEVDNYINTMVQTCNGVFTKIGYSRSFSTSDFVVNVPSNCNCFKKY